MIKSFITNESGAASVEYALVAALVSVAGLKSLHCITMYCLAPTFSNIAAFLQGTPTV